VVTLDLPEVRGEIVRYALNSEIFYAFPVAYLISILKKLMDISSYQQPSGTSLSGRIPRTGMTLADEDIRDLMKTLQIQLCLKRAELSGKTIKKLSLMHQTLPVLNVQFLLLMLDTANRARGEQS
jgi:hypothetical protein